MSKTFTTQTWHSNMLVEDVRDQVNAMFGEVDVDFTELFTRMTAIEASAVTSDVLLGYVEKDGSKVLSDVNFSTTLAAQLAAVVAESSTNADAIDAHDTTITAHGTAISANETDITTLQGTVASNTALLGFAKIDLASALVADASNYGAIRVIEDGGASQTEICLRNGADSYEWKLLATVTIV